LIESSESLFTANAYQTPGDRRKAPFWPSNEAQTLEAMIHVAPTPSAPTVQVVLVPVPGRLGRGIKRPGNLGPLVAGFPGGRHSFLNGIAQVLTEAVPVGHGSQRIGWRLELGQISGHLTVRFLSVAGAFVQSSPKVIHSAIKSTQPFQHKSIAVRIDSKQYLLDDRSVEHPKRDQQLIRSNKREAVR
jgi:hypothetical protein